MFAVPVAAQDFLNSITKAAAGVGKELGLYPRIIIAQSALETGWGKSVKGNSYFGIKAHGIDNTVDFTTHESLDGKRNK